jgi:hypothetical protein
MTFGPAYLVPGIVISVWVYLVRGQRVTAKLVPWFAAIVLYLAAPIAFGSFQDSYVVLGWAMLVLALAFRAFRGGAATAAMILLLLPVTWSIWSVLLFMHRGSEQLFWLAMGAVPATMVVAFLAMILWEGRRNAM